MAESRLPATPAATCDVGALLREVDRLLPRPAGAPISIARLEALAQRKRTRALWLLLLAALLPGLAGAALALVRQRPVATRDAGLTRWLRTVRSHDSELRLRELLSLQRVERARERAAIATTIYAERVHADDPARGAALLQSVVAALPGTRGAHDATRFLTALSADHR